MARGKEQRIAHMVLVLALVIRSHPYTFVSSYVRVE